VRLRAASVPACCRRASTQPRPGPAPWAAGQHAESQPSPCIIPTMQDEEATAAGEAGASEPAPTGDAGAEELELDLDLAKKK